MKPGIFDRVTLQALANKLKMANSPEILTAELISKLRETIGMAAEEAATKDSNCTQRLKPEVLTHLIKFLCDGGYYNEDVTCKDGDIISRKELDFNHKDIEALQKYITD